MNLEDLKALYDLACTAPLRQAAHSHQVSELLKKVEAELQKGAATLAMEQAKKHLESVAP